MTKAFVMALEWCTPHLMGRGLDQTLAVLNGLVGDYLSRRRNGLATEMACYREGRVVPLDSDGLARVYPNASPRVCVLVHGLMCTETIWHMPDGSDYGSLLEGELGWTACYVRYNSGLAIADNGAHLSRLLERLVGAYPVPIEELVPIGYSMGGLVIRSACHAAGLSNHGWLERVRRAIYVGTPHLGAPAERFGRLTTELLKAVRDPYAQLFADIGNLRSRGIQDLGHADLRHEDRDQLRSAWDLRDVRHPLPLLASIEHHLIAGSIFTDPRLAFLFGDSLVPVVSATYRDEAAVAEEVLPPERVTLLPGLSHIALARHAQVYERIKNILEPQRG